MSFLWTSHPNEVYMESFMKTVESYKSIGKEVLVVLTVPQSANPRSCINKKYKISSRNICNIDLNKAISIDGNYRMKFKNVLKKNELFDP
jgi:hypothetical protein